MVLNRPDDFYRRIGVDGMVGFGEAFQLSDWDSSDPADAMTRLLTGLDAFVPSRLRFLRQHLTARRPAKEDNTVAGAKESIHYHYDLSNEFFALFLDPSMTYSSAIFNLDSSGVLLADRASLCDAQLKKVNRLLDLAEVGQGTRVLEIGTGWGELAIQAARRGANVRTVTISANQREMAMRRIVDENLQDRVRVDICDYRDLDPGQSDVYDAILCVEMIEAVGEKYWPEFFSTVDRLLTAEGRFALQAITMRHDRFLATRYSHNWINKYIFPGGLVPSLPALEAVLSGCTQLRIRENSAFGLHYAATLKLWRIGLSANKEEAKRLGADEMFVRTWTMYLASCEAGFRTGSLDVNQLLLGR